MQRGIRVAAWPLLLCVSVAQADETVPAATPLDTVIVTASRVPETLSEALAAVSSGGDNDGKTLRRRARESGRIDVDRDFGRGSLGASVVAVGKRYEDAANTQTLGGYATLALRGELRLLPAVTLQASVSNALNKEYETARDFNQPGTGYWLGLRYRPTP